MSNPLRIAVLTLIVVASLGTVTMMQPRVTVPDPASAPTAGVLYAAPVERVETHVLRSGQTLSGVLSQARISGCDSI
jgi:hypothetical protein